MAESLRDQIIAVLSPHPDRLPIATCDQCRRAGRYADAILALVADARRKQEAELNELTFELADRITEHHWLLARISDGDRTAFERLRATVAERRGKQADPPAEP